MLENWGMEATRLNLMLFMFFDTDNSSQLNFAEYTATLWNFLTVGNVALNVFLMADGKGQGYITDDQCKNLIETLHGIDDLQRNKNMFKCYMAMKDAMTDIGKITLENFLEGVLNGPTLVNPIFLLQAKLKKMVLSESIWNDQLNNRYYIN